jgi:pimeloyl-ACP methyl ester carboxylesterase
MALQIKSVAVRTGVVLPFVERGGPGGFPVILLHGYTDSWCSFSRLLPHMPPALRTLVPTQRGHGEATRPLEGYRPRHFADDLAAFMDALALERALILGHSMGSSIALRFALDHPSRVAGLVLVGAFACLRASPVADALWAAVQELRDPIDPGFVLEFQQSTIAQPVEPAFLQLVVEESRKLPARVWQAALAGLMESDLSVELGGIAAPTLLAWGDRDEIATREEQRRLLAAISAARLATYRGVGHAPHWEVPARVAADIANFAAEIGRIGTTSPAPRREIAAA